MLLFHLLLYMDLTCEFSFHGLRLYNFGSRGRGKEERWHAPLAGAVAGLALLIEKADSRTAVAQQVLIRSLQGAVHRGHRRGFRIPHGDVILFGLSCGTIMYSWVVSNSRPLRPHSFMLRLSSHPTCSIEATTNGLRYSAPVFVGRTS